MTAEAGGPALHPMFAPEYLNLLEECSAVLQELAECFQELAAAADVAAGDGVDVWLEKRQLFREARARCRDVLKNLDEHLEGMAGENGNLVIGHGGSVP